MPFTVIRPVGKGKMPLSPPSPPCGPTVPGLDYFPTYHDGLGGALKSGVLANVQVVTIFWGDSWAQVPQDPSTEATPEFVNLFFDTILSSSLMDMISSEYSIGENVIGHGSLVESIQVPDSWGSLNLGTSVTASDIRQLVRDLVNDGEIPWTINMLYMVYISKTAVVIDDSGQQSCLGNSFIGYHDWDNGSYFISPNNLITLVIGVVCPCSNDKDTITKVTSHEMCEAITHPYNPKIWYTGWNGVYTGPDKNLGYGEHKEIGDECYNFAVCDCPTPRIDGFAVQPIWSRRQAACAIAPWPWTSLPYPAINSPVIASDGQNLMLAWTEPFAEFGAIRVINNAANGSLDFSGPGYLNVPGDPHPQLSLDRPALCIGLWMKFAFIAWIGTDRRLNIVQCVGDAALYPGDISGNRTTFSDRSYSAPALTAAPLLSSGNAVFGMIFLAYTDLNRQIHIRWTTDGVWYDANANTLQQWSPDGPCICYADPYLYLSFRGTNNDEIYVCRTADLGQSLEVHRIPGQATDNTPALTVVGNQLILAWRGTDSDHRINAMSTDLTSADPLGSFGNQVVYGDLANGALSMVTYPERFVGGPFISWAGTDSLHSLNVMPLPPYNQNCYS